jgi:hypothetical protein
MKMLHISILSLCVFFVVVVIGISSTSSSQETTFDRQTQNEQLSASDAFCVIGVYFRVVWNCYKIHFKGYFYLFCQPITREEMYQDLS